MNLVENFNGHMNDDRIYGYKMPHFAVNKNGDSLVCEGDVRFDNGYFGPGINLWYRFAGYSPVRGHVLGAKSWRIER